MHLSVQLAVALLDEVLHDLNPRYDHFFEDALPLIHLNHSCLLGWINIELIEDGV